MAKFADILNPLFTFMSLERVVAPSVNLYPAMVGIMNSSKASFARSVLLYDVSDTGRMYGFAKELPIPIKFASTSLHDLYCEFYGYIPRHPNKCYATRYRDDFEVEKRLIFSLQPFLVQSAALKKQIRSILRTNPGRILIVATHSHKETLQEFSDILCSVVSVTSEDTNVPHDMYRMCASRKRVHTPTLLAQERSPIIFPKHHVLRVIARQERAYGKLTPEALALLDAFKTLNNTISVVKLREWRHVMLKRADISLPPTSALVLHHFGVFADAHYSPSPRCFFTAMRQFSEITSIDSWGSLLWLSLCLTIHAGILTVYMYIRCRLLYSRQTRQHNSHVMMFLVSTLLGISPASSVSNSPTFRGFACAIWVLGMMVLGFYIQSSVTAIRMTPTSIRAVGSLEELSRFALARTVTPCFNSDWSFIMFSPVDRKHSMFLRNILAAGIGSLLKIYPGTPFSECYRRTRAGTHVALSVCTDDEIAVASQWNLVPGERFFIDIQAPAIHVMHPLRYPTRRLLMAISEAGLAAPHRKIMVPESFSEEHVAETFELHFIVYIVGCALSCSALAVEVLMQPGFRCFLWKLCARFWRAAYKYSFGLLAKLIQTLTVDWNAN